MVALRIALPEYVNEYPVVQFPLIALLEMTLKVTKTNDGSLELEYACSTLLEKALAT